jgi:hypothetical protein
MKLHPWCREYMRSAFLALVGLIHIQGDAILTHGNRFLNFNEKWLGVIIIIGSGK